jgi:glycosyltransferase involved in cell wall biosynthesis
MIVKDAAPEILARCLASVRPLIDFWIIVDSGSTDGTPGVVRSVLHDIPGELHERPWVDFGHNRSEALRLARAHGDYTLIIDAADVLELPPGFRMPFLKRDSYAVEIWNGEHHYWRPQLVRNSVAWRYEGVLHEFLSCASGPDNGRVLPHERSHKRLPGPRIRITEDGVRREFSANERYRDDAAVLERAAATETDPFLVARYKFQLAQSYLDAGDKEKALTAYQERATLGFWDQEVFISLYRSANLKADLGYDEEDVIASYLRAYNISKDRAEALYGAARFCRIKQKYQQGFDLAKRALKIKPPTEALFLEEWVYQYALLDEFAVNAFWIGYYDDCLAACERLLREGKIPAEDRERIEQNARFARDKLSARQADAKNGDVKAAFSSGSQGEAPTSEHAVAVQSPIKTIGLCMIVKNESHVILRCLESVRSLVDYVLVEDTGSTDGTQALIRDWLDRVGLPGEVYDAPWQDFAYNRSHVLARLRENKDIDYALMIDADDQLIVDADFDVVAFKKNLSKDQYDVEMRQGGVRYRNPQICSNRREFRYRSVLHEFLQSPPGDVSTGAATGFHIISGREGARSQDPNKYRKDAQVLEQALRSEEDAFLRSRYIFYLAQSYRDAGEREKALENYLKRAEIGVWTEEVFMSLYAAAQIQQQMGRPLDEVIATYLRASDVMPSRAEALHGASRFSREKNRFAEGYELASRGLKIPLPVGGLFVEPWIYDYGLLDEFAINAYWIGRYDDCLAACERLLREGKIPAEDRERIEQNARFAREKLSSQPEQLTARATEFIAAASNEMRQGETPQTALGGESEEVFLSLYNAAEHLRTMGRPFDEVVAAYERASNAAPSRAEALHSASRFSRENNRFAEGYEYARRGLKIPSPDSGRSVQHWIYDYGLLDEFAVNAYWIGGYDDCLAACERLLREGKIPAEDRERVEQNARFAREKLSSQPEQQTERATEFIDAASNEMRQDETPQTALGESKEVFVNLYNAAEHLRTMGRPFDEVVAAYERASNAAPSRAEALHSASRFSRENNRFAEGYEYARRGLKIPSPDSGRSVQHWIYDYGLLDEFAVNAYWTERYQDCLEACRRLLIEGRMPKDMYDRVRMNADFAADKIRLQGLHSEPQAVPMAGRPEPPKSFWTPSRAAGGTELMVEGLGARIPDALARIQLQVNLFPDNPSDPKPLVIWIHHDVDQAAVQWLQDREKVRRVARFVFVSKWQQARFVKQFGLPSERCVVLRNATEVCSSNRIWHPGKPLRMGYASIPYRGLSVLLDAWDQLRPADAELHIWSSIKLYGPGFDEEPYRNLYDRAMLLPGVEYHGLVPNAELRSALRNMHFLTYPSTFAETSCLSVIEAMAAGCRVICPSFGALPETTGRFARLYRFLSDPADHAKLFAQVLAEEILDPWCGNPELSGQQQNYVRQTYDWSVRVAEWEAFIDLAVSSRNVPRG